MELVLRENLSTDMEQIGVLVAKRNWSQAVIGAWINDPRHDEKTVGVLTYGTQTRPLTVEYFAPKKK